MIPESVIRWLQGALNPNGINNLMRKWGLSGLPIGEAASLLAAKLLQEKYGVNIPGGTEILAAYIRNDFAGFINGEPEEIAETLNNQKRCFNLFGSAFCFGGNSFDWKIIAGIGIVGFLAYKFFKA